MKPNLSKYTIKQTKMGFTLIELLIVLAITGIIFTSALPAFSQMISNSLQEAHVHKLFKHHQMARSEAIKTQHQIYLCKSRDGTQCQADANWHDGWIIFSDTNLNRRMDNEDKIITVEQALPAAMTIKYRGLGSSNYVRYYPDGHSNNGTFTLCHQSQAESAQSVIISRTGRARLDNKTSGGGALTCL